MGYFLATETLIIELLLIASLVAIVVRRLRIPYTVALVIVGLVITFQQGLKIEITSELILALFVPPLVFEAAFHIGFDRLRKDLMLLLLLAVPGVVLTMVVVGLMVWAGVGLPLDRALLFGALVSATDPVAVVALFRAIGAPKRLATLLEAESLFNDGTAIVIFNLVLAVVLSTVVSNAAPLQLPADLLGAVVDFGRVSLGGIGIGLVLGWVVSLLIARVDDYLIETTLTTVLAFGSYLVAEGMHTSGVLAVVVAGMVIGNIGPRGMGPTTRIVLFNFWEYMAFLANSMVFLLIGLQVNIPNIVAQTGPIAVAVIATLASRGLVVYGVSWLVSLGKDRIPGSYQHVMFWGGLRGAVSLALALSLPAALPERDLLKVMAFGVVLFTLLAQGTSMQWLIARLGLLKREEMALEYERRHARVMAIDGAIHRLQELQRDGAISTTTANETIAVLEMKSQARLEDQRELLKEHPELQEEEHEVARREALHAQRATLASLRNDGVISDQVHDEMTSSIDAAIEAEMLDDSLDPFGVSDETSGEPK